MKPGQWILLLIGTLTLFSFTKMNYTTILKNFLPSVEGFSEKPYWDFKQWSWGYGTKVPGSAADENVKPTGTITQDDAFSAMLNHIEADKTYLSKYLKVSLNPNQWAALLSFAYNLGARNADNLIPNINNNNNEALKIQWHKYVYAGGFVLPSLVERRKKEWGLYVS